MIIRYQTYRNKSGNTIAEAWVKLRGIAEPRHVLVGGTHAWLAVETLRRAVFKMLASLPLREHPFTAMSPPSTVHFVHVGLRRYCGLCKCKVGCPCSCHNKKGRHQHG